MGMGTPEGKRACVIGAGFGGLALAIRLQAAGVATTLIEAREEPGGRAQSWQRDGFTFDAGPGAIVDPASLHALWDLTGHAMADDVELLPVSPFCRYSWPDGTQLDWSNDPAALRDEIARIAPGDVAGYVAFLDYASAVRHEADSLAAQPLLRAGDMLRAAPALAAHKPWRSLHQVAGQFVRHDKLRQALSFPVLAIGGNPLTASAMHAAMQKLTHEGGVWWPRGGTGRVVAALVRQFERLGGSARLGDPVVRIETIGTRASEIATGSSWRGAFDAVASDADPVHTYRELLGETLRGQQAAKKWSRKRFGPGVFAVHFAIEGSWPGIPHRSVLFGPRYEGWLEDVFDHGVLPADMALWLHHPSVTDPSLAPEGASVFSAAMPVANQGRLTIDWRQVGPMLEQRVLDEVGRRLIPDIHDRILTRFHRTPRDQALDFRAHLGSAFGLEPCPTQSGAMRVPHRDAVIGNLYMVGASTHPGGGIPGVLAGARSTAGLMLEDLSR
jgi:phytoene desaturase